MGYNPHRLILRAHARCRIAKANNPAGALVADVGTGRGFVATGLAPTADKVYSFDASLAAFYNIYLHHGPEPPAAIREMSHVLKPGGVVCIRDLDTHDHTWQPE